MAVTGTRLYPDEQGVLALPDDARGAYGYGRLLSDSTEFHWWVHVPARGFGWGRICNHDITEHEDGTITVSPSILVNTGTRSWHGYLERGIWREC